MSGPSSTSPSDVDFSVIRTSIDMGHTMLDQILNGIHYGSEEVRALLREECDFIMECKVCRNLFRSFPNFVAHKRVYCMESCEERIANDIINLKRPERETVVVLPESPDKTKGGKKAKGKSVDNEKRSKNMSQKESLVDQVVNKTYQSNSVEYELYTKAAEKIVHSKAGKTTTTIKLTPIPSSTKAMTVEYSNGDTCIEKNVTSTENKDDSLNPTTSKKKSSLSEVCASLLGKHSDKSMVTNVLQQSPSKKSSQPDRNRKSTPKKLVGNASENESNKGSSESKQTHMEVDDAVSEWSGSSKQSSKVKDNSPSSKSSPERMETSPSEKDTEASWMKMCDFKKLKCTECKKGFSTVHSLKYHCKTIHSEGKFFSKCPICHKEFCYFASVARHLSNVHKKSEQQIQEYKKKMNARSKFVEVISPESMIKLHSGSAEKTNNKSSYTHSWKKCDKCQKFFSKAKSYKRHILGKCSPKANSEKPAKDFDKGASERLTQEAEYVYEEKTLNKTSRLYKALASPTGGKPPTVVYVYPKSPIQDASFSRQKSKEADVFDEKSRKHTSMEMSKKKKSLRNNVNRENDTLTIKGKETKENKKVEETKRNETKVTDSVDIGHKTINENDESTVLSDENVLDFENDHNEDIDSANSISCNPSYANDKVETRSVSSERQAHKNETTDVKNRSSAKSKGTPQKIEDPKTKVELNKLKHRLMTEAIGAYSKTQEIETDIQAGLKNRQDMTDEPHDFDLEKTVSQDEERTPVKTNEGRYSSALRSSVSSASESPLPKSGPTSPSSVSSMDGYSHKFKMTVQEMAELVETASLTKFAKERKKRAHNILNKKNAKDMLGGNLATAMKRTIKGRSILPRKTYSTRFKSGTVTKGKINVSSRRGKGLKNTTQDQHSQVLNQGFMQQMKLKQKGKNDKNSVITKVNQKEALHGSIDKSSKNAKDSVTHQTEKQEKIFNDLEDDGGNSQSKKLPRELKLLENTPGFNKESYYDFRTGAESHKQSHSEATGELSKASSSQLTDEILKSALDTFKQKLLGSTQSLNNSNLQASKTTPDTVCIDQSAVKGSKLQGEGKVRLSRSDMHNSKTTHESYLKPTDKGRGNSHSRSPSSVSDVSMSDKDSVTGTRSSRKGVELDSLSSSRDTSLERKGSGVSKKLNRELKLLENSSGFNEKGYYQSPSDSKDKTDNQQAGELKNKSITSQFTKPNDMKDMAATRNERTSDTLTVVKPHDQKKNITTKGLEKKEVFKSFVEIQPSESNKIANSRDLSYRVRQHDSPQKSKGGKQSHVDKRVENKLDAPEHDKPDAGTNVNAGKSSGTAVQGGAVLDNPKGNVTSNELKDDFADATAAHRTRLSTGSIFFDSELLKTSPSKFDPVEIKAPADTDKQALDRIRKRLSLSPRRRSLLQAEKIVRQRNKSGPERFSLETGVKKCEQCGKKFWKIKSFRLHVRRCKCGSKGEQTKLSEEAIKKRTLSRSPRNVDNVKSYEGEESGDHLSKRPRLAIGDASGHKVGSGEEKGSENVEFPMVVMKKNIDEVIMNKIKEKEQQDKKRKDMAEDALEIEILQRNTPRHHTLSNDETNANENANSAIQTEVAGPSHSLADDSDAESDFSGFSEKDLEEQDIQVTNKDTEEGSFQPNTMLLNERAKRSRMSRTNKSSIGAGIVKREGLRQKKANPWTKKRSSSTPFWSYVCDSKKPRKMLCQATKNIDKMVDTQRLVCKYCGSKHTSVSNLRQHAIRHLGWKRYKCKVCTFTGYNRSEVRLHISRKHSIKSTEFNNYVTDLKTEARKIRSSRRSNTLREHKAQALSSQSSSDIYAKPRPNVGIAKTKAGRNIKRDASDADSSDKGQNENNNLSSKDDESSSALLKARQRLTTMLTP